MTRSRAVIVSGATGLVLLALFFWPEEARESPLRVANPSIDSPRATPEGASPTPEMAPLVAGGQPSQPPTGRQLSVVREPRGRVVEEASEPISAAPLRGRLLDRRTSEPIPEFLVRARGPRTEVAEHSGDGEVDDPSAHTFAPDAPVRRVEDIVTGADGRFASSGGFEAGALDLLLIDHASWASIPPDEQRTSAHRHSLDQTDPPTELEIRIVVGPTYRLDIALPEGMDVGEFHATLQETPGLPQELHRMIAEDPDSSMARFYGAGLRSLARGQEAPLRAGTPIWTRFRSPVIPVGAEAETRAPQELHVRSRDGLWSGTAVVTSLPGIYPQTVPVTLSACAAIEGTVLDGAGNAVPTAWIQLTSPSAPSRPAREIGADAQGAFAFQWLAEGEYDIAIRTDRYDEWKSRLSVAAGSIQRLEARLSAGLPLGTISGVLRSNTGQHRSKGGVLSLLSLDDPGFFLIKTVSYRKQKGEHLAPFSFEKVPSGRYELVLQPLDNLRWKTLRMEVSSPAEGLEFLCEDDLPTFDLEFRAVDAETGAAPGEIWHILWQGDPLDDVRMHTDYETGLYLAVPDTIPLRWVLRAEGYRLATGDESDLRADGARRVVEARLVRGWGQVFKVTTREQGPIAGVELLADGASLGITNAQGVVSMNLDSKPERIEFRYPGWHVSWGAVDPAGEQFGWGPETPVHLSRD